MLIIPPIIAVRNLDLTSIKYSDISHPRIVCMICQWQMNRLKKWFDSKDKYGKCKDCKQKTNVRPIGTMSYCYFCFLEKDLK